MYELKKNGEVFTSKFVGTRPSSYEKRIYRGAVSQRLRNTALQHQRSLILLTSTTDMKEYVLCTLQDCCKLVCQILPNCGSSLGSSTSCFHAMQPEPKTSSIMHNADDSCTIFTNKYGYKTIGIYKIGNINTRSHTESIPCYENQSLTEFTHFKKSAYIYIYLPEY